MGLGFSLLASIFIADEQPFQAAGGGLLIGFAVIGVVLAPLKISTILRGLLAVGVGIGTFLIAWVLGWLFVPAAWWMIVMGAVAGAGFYFGLRCKSMGPTQEET
jgi:hypothetical protein